MSAEGLALVTWAQLVADPGRLLALSLAMLALGPALLCLGWGLLPASWKARVR